MAGIILSDVTVSLGSITLGTNAIKSCTINFNPAMQPNTGMGHTAQSRIKGLDDWSIDLEIFQSFVDDALDEDLWTLVSAGTTVGVISIKPTSAGAGAANPNYTSTAGIIESYQPIAAAAVGDLAVVKLRILAMGASLTRSLT